MCFPVWNLSRSGHHQTGHSSNNQHLSVHRSGFIIHGDLVDLLERNQGGLCYRLSISGVQSRSPSPRHKCTLRTCGTLLLLQMLTHDAFSSVLLLVPGETQSVIKALYVSLYLHTTCRSSQVAWLPVTEHTCAWSLTGAWLISCSGQWEQREGCWGSEQVTVADSWWSVEAGVKLCRHGCECEVKLGMDVTKGDHSCSVLVKIDHNFL